MIAANARFYFEHTITSWCKVSADTEWVQDSIAPFLNHEEGHDRITGACEDVRPPNANVDSSQLMWVILSTGQAQRTT